MERLKTTLAQETGKEIFASSQLSMFNVLKDFDTDTKLLNIWKSFSLRNNITESIIYYDQYIVEHVDWWDDISYKVYGESAYWWTIALVNNIVNPFEELYPGAHLKVLKTQYMYQLVKEIKALSIL